MKPRIFVSTVSSELGKLRQLTANVLQGLGYDPVWQDIFGTEPGDLRQMLRDKIDACEGLIQIVGKGYGAEPSVPDPEFGRVSYTQYEYLYARKRGKKTWVLFAEEGCTYDKPLDRLDLPSDPDHPDPAGYQLERRALQKAWRQRLEKLGQLYYPVSSDTELELKLERLNRQFAELRREFRRWQHATEEGIAEIKTQVQEVGKAQAITLDRVRGHLRDASEQALQREQAEAEKAPLFDDRERLREAAQKAHEARLSRVEDIAAEFVALSEREDTSPILREMLRILNTQGETHAVEKAIAYLERQLHSILERVDTRNRAAQERNRIDLRPVLEAARLAQANGQPDAARKHYEEVVKREPDWPDAIEPYAYFLFDQSYQSKDHGSLQAAVSDADRSLELAKRLYSQDETKPEAQRLLSVASNAIGDGLVLRGQAGDADQALKHYERSLELREALLKRNPDSAQTARDVMVSHYKLGEFEIKREEFESAIVRFRQGVQVLDAMIAKGLNAEKAGQEKAILVRRVQFCLATLATGDWDALLQRDPAILPRLLSCRASEMARRGQLVEVDRSGAKLRELEPKSGDNLYGAACAYGLCAGLVVKDNQEPTRAEEQRRYVGLALACLKEAIDAGYHDFAQMRQDTDLSALRGLPEFERLFPKEGPK